jgi:hypothetical protein
MRPPLPVDEHDSEPTPGLPDRLPPLERILWQGSPDWRGIAHGALHTRWVACYFALLVAWRAAHALTSGEAGGPAAAGVARLAALGLAALSLLWGIAWLYGRTTIYTITTHRVVLRFGVALTLAVNLPFREIQRVGLRPRADGTGDVSLAISSAERLSYLMLWPHVRARRFGRELEPMLRALKDARAVGELLSSALVGDPHELREHHDVVRVRAAQPHVAAAS